MPGACGLLPCDRTHLKKALCHIRPVMGRMINNKNTIITSFLHIAWPVFTSNDKYKHYILSEHCLTSLLPVMTNTTITYFLNIAWRLRFHELLRRRRDGRYSFPWITQLYPRSLPYNAECLLRRHQVPFLECLVWLNLGLKPVSRAIGEHSNH